MRSFDANQGEPQQIHLDTGAAGFLKELHSDGGDLMAATSARGPNVWEDPLMAALKADSIRSKDQYLSL